MFSSQDLRFTLKARCVSADSNCSFDFVSHADLNDKNPDSRVRYSSWDVQEDDVTNNPFYQQPETEPASNQHEHQAFTPKPPSLPPKSPGVRTKKVILSPRPSISKATQARESLKAFYLTQAQKNAVYCQHWKEAHPVEPDEPEVARIPPPRAAPIQRQINRNDHLQRAENKQKATSALAAFYAQRAQANAARAKRNRLEERLVRQAQVGRL